MPYLPSVTLAIAAVCVEQSRQTQSQFYNEVVNVPCSPSNTEGKVRRVVWVHLCASMKLKKNQIKWSSEVQDNYLQQQCRSCTQTRQQTLPWYLINGMNPRTIYCPQVSVPARVYSWNLEIMWYGMPVHQQQVSLPGSSEENSWECGPEASWMRVFPTRAAGFSQLHWTSSHGLPVWMGRREFCHVGAVALVKIPDCPFLEGFLLRVQWIHLKMCFSLHWYFQYKHCRSAFSWLYWGVVGVYEADR